MKEGAPSKIVQEWLNGEAELVTSPVLLAELEEVLSRPRIQKYQWMRKEDVAKLLVQLKQSTIQASGQRLVQVISEDPDDDFVLSAALETYADYIVSGDRHLIELAEYKGIKIVLPVEFLKILKKRAGTN